MVRGSEGPRRGDTSPSCPKRQGRGTGRVVAYGQPHHFHTGALQRSEASFAAITRKLMHPQ